METFLIPREAMSDWIHKAQMQVMANADAELDRLLGRPDRNTEQGAQMGRKKEEWDNGFTGPIEPGFLEPLGDRWVFLRTPENCCWLTIPVGAILENKPARWFASTLPSPEDMCAWRIIGVGGRVWGIPTSWARDLLEASGINVAGLPDMFTLTLNRRR